MGSLVDRFWRRFWLARGGVGWKGRLATRLAALGAADCSAPWALASLSTRGFISPGAEVIEADLRLGEHVFVGDRAILACWKGMVQAVAQEGPAREEGVIALGDWARIEREAVLEVFEGGFIRIGRGSFIRAGSVLLAAVQPILVGDRVVIGPGCALFPYDHQFAPGTDMLDQPLDSRGPIVVEDDARLGAGVTVLSGVTIGRGAIVQAGSVVTRDVPAKAFVSGAPARIPDAQRMEQPESVIPCATD
ncbi:MAG: DapH/DapD/GlmU-related protein [Verrucomicrobiia bacterium]